MIDRCVQIKLRKKRDVCLEELTKRASNRVIIFSLISHKGRKKICHLRLRFFPNIRFLFNRYNISNNLDLIINPLDRDCERSKTLSFKVRAHKLES